METELTAAGLQQKEVCVVVGDDPAQVGRDGGKERGEIARGGDRVVQLQKGVPVVAFRLKLVLQRRYPLIVARDGNLA